MVRFEKDPHCKSRIWYTHANCSYYSCKHRFEVKKSGKSKEHPPVGSVHRITEVLIQQLCRRPKTGQEKRKRPFEKQKLWSTEGRLAVPGDRAWRSYKSAKSDSHCRCSQRPSTHKACPREAAGTSALNQKEAPVTWEKPPIKIRGGLHFAVVRKLR